MLQILIDQKIKSLLLIKSKNSTSWDSFFFFFLFRSFSSQRNPKDSAAEVVMCALHQPFQDLFFNPCLCYCVTLILFLRFEKPCFDFEWLSVGVCVFVWECMRELSCDWSGLAPGLGSLDWWTAGLLPWGQLGMGHTGLPFSLFSSFLTISPLQSWRKQIKRSWGSGKVAGPEM